MCIVVVIACNNFTILHFAIFLVCCVLSFSHDRRWFLRLFSCEYIKIFLVLAIPLKYPTFRCVFYPPEL
jgi:hypothetical protein